MGAPLQRGASGALLRASVSPGGAYTHLRPVGERARASSPRSGHVELCREEPCEAGGRR